MDLGSAGPSWCLTGVTGAPQLGLVQLLHTLLLLLSSLLQGQDVKAGVSLRFAAQSVMRRGAGMEQRPRFPVLASGAKRKRFYLLPRAEVCAVAACLPSPGGHCRSRS